MPAQADVPEGRAAERRWRQLPPRRRRELLLRGHFPADRDEATTALGFARLMLSRNVLWAGVGAFSAFLVTVALHLLLQEELPLSAFALAGSIGLGVGVGLAVTGRVQAGRLERQADERLADAIPPG